jgi:hypothetical protein
MFYKMSSNQRETAISFDFPLLPEGFSKKNSQKTKWVLMRLDATTLTDKKQICNFKHTEEKQNSLPGEKQNKFSLL